METGCSRGESRTYLVLALAVVPPSTEGAIFPTAQGGALRGAAAAPRNEEPEPSLDSGLHTPVWGVSVVVQR